MTARPIDKVLLYDEGASEALRLDGVVTYLAGKLGKDKVALKGNPLAHYPSKSKALAHKLASLRIQDAAKKPTPGEAPLYGEVSFEERRLRGKTRAFGVLYDGFGLAEVFSELVLPAERSLKRVHIFFTNLLFATWDDNNRHYHARTSIYGLPSLISTTGLVEAPARSREYYLLKQQYDFLGNNPRGLAARFKGRFLDYDDARLTEAVKGYAMQAIFYHLTGDPFCPDKGCRLYNAHWQEDLIFAQFESGYEFCARHAEILKGFHQQ
ncbi:DUF6775 family putative metallopeptidase [Chloroflexota bacterium]